ncbi:MAG: DUF2390 domain-containing protein [Proteobacteria bacterium]|nr:DUF2390 domain-containing protein [Pseudomonadota bacterium]
MSALATHPFVLFVRDLPQRKAIFKIILSLQENNYLNPNVILYSVWYALVEQGRLRRPEFKKIQTALHPWHDRIVEPLQHLAAALEKSRTMQQWVLIEIDQAQQLEQQMLTRALNPIKKNKRNIQQQLSDAAFNLASYYKVMRIHLNDNLRRLTIELLQFFFLECNEQAVVQSLEQALHSVQLEESGFVQLSLM